MTRIGVLQASALWLKDGIEAGDEHIRRDASHQRLVNSLKYLPRRGGVQRLSGNLQHAASCGHNQCCRHSLARCIAHHKPKFALREDVEVIEVTSYLPSWLVVRGNLPAL